VKRGLILEAIAKKEGVEVSDVEVDAEIGAPPTKTPDFAKSNHRLRHDSGKKRSASLAQEKALRWC